MGCINSGDGNGSEGDIDKLYLQPAIPIKIVFEKVGKCCGINDESLSIQYVEKLTNLWYYRSYDLSNVNKEIWDQLKIPITLKNQLFKYIENCKKHQSYIQFSEAVSKQKNISYILDELESDNKSESTSNDIKILRETFARLYLLNIETLRKYLDETVWNQMNVPEYLKIIILQKIGLKFEGQKGGFYEGHNGEQEGENDVLFPDVEELKYDLQKATDRGQNNKGKKIGIKATCPMTEICTVLAERLFAKNDEIMQDLSPLFKFNYNRIYHLSQINDEIYNKLLSEIPKSLKNELYDMITNVRGYNINALPFYYNYDDNKKLKAIDIDWTMRTDQLFEILEQDINLEKGQLSADCDIMMNNFYSNLWDWFFIPNDFWKTLPGYNAFEVVRIRINDLCNHCVQKFNINNNKTVPTVPESWLKKYDVNLSVEQVLFGGNKKKFNLDGVDWSENTIQNTRLISDYLSKNYVGKLQFIQEEHCNNNEIWTKYMNDNKIPPHIRFKINYYSIRGHIQTNDEWLNEYIRNNYPTLPPQYEQDILPPTPIFSIKRIKSNSASILFSTEMKYEYHIEIMEEEEKESNWNQVATIRDKQSYLCKNLKSGITYQVRTRCKDENIFGRYSEIESFKTKFPEMKFNKKKKGRYVNFKGRNVVSKAKQDGNSVCIFGEEINNKMCNEFEMDIKWQKCASGGQFYMGYITSTIQDSVKNWNDCLGFGDNEEHSVAFMVSSGYNYFYQYRKGNENLLNYRAPSNFQKGDTFKLLFSFGDNKLIIYHNETESETVTLDNCKTFTPAIIMYSHGDEIKITKYEFR